MEKKPGGETDENAGQEFGSRFEGAVEVASLEEFLERARKLGFSSEEIEKMRITYSRDIKEDQK